MDYEGMKVLGLNIYFKLPDDFEGGLTKALEEYIKYRKENNLKDFPDYDIPKKSRLTLWNDFLDAVKKGFRMHGEWGISKIVNGECINQREKGGIKFINESE